MISCSWRWEPLETRFKENPVEPPRPVRNRGKGGRRVGDVCSPVEERDRGLWRGRGYGRTRRRQRRSGPHHRAGQQDLSARMGRIWRGTRIGASARSEPAPTGHLRRTNRTGGPPTSSGRTRALRRLEQGIRTRYSHVRRSQGADHHRHLLRAGALCIKTDRDQRRDHAHFHRARLGGSAAARETARGRLHQELQNLKPVLECPREGADRQLDSALHRPDQPRRSDPRARRHRQLHQCRQSAARRAARVSQRLRLLQCLGPPDRGGDEHRA